MKTPSLVKFAWLSVGAAGLTILLKLGAYWITGSVGLLSDAMEGGVNLAAATVALFILRIVERPPDKTHTYGHDKAEYFSSGIEGTLIFVAAIGIGVTGGQRLLQPHPLQQPGLGLVIAGLAALINLAVGQTLIRVGRKHHSITLEADGQHLMSDVWTSGGVIAGVGIAALTGQSWLDPVMALVVGVKIGWEGGRIFWRSLMGLMDTAIAPAEVAEVEMILNHYTERYGVQWHALRTRRAGARRFINVHLLAPGQWTVQQAHNLSEQIEAEIRQVVPRATILTHIEPLEDPISMKDIKLDRPRSSD